MKKPSCARCEKRYTCKKLCAEMEKYVSQDRVPQWSDTRFYLHDKGLTESAFKGIGSEEPGYIKLLIHRLLRDGKAPRDIAQLLPRTERYIRYVKKSIEKEKARIARLRK